MANKIRTQRAPVIAGTSKIAGSLKYLIRGRLLDVVDGSPLIRRRSFNMVNHDDFDGPLSGFQFQAKLLLKGVEQRGGIGIGWGYRKPFIWCEPGRRLEPVIRGELEFEVIDALQLGFIQNGVAKHLR